MFKGEKRLKRIICFFVLGITIFFLISYLFNNGTRKENNEDEDIIEIIDKKMTINGHDILVPQILGDKNDIQSLNKILIKEIECYIDKESNLYDFNYIIKHNDGNYVSLIIEILQNKKTLPHPGKQAHAINIDIRGKKLLQNNDLVEEKKDFCEDIKNGRYKLSNVNEIPNNVAYPSGYIEKKTLDEIEEMYDNRLIEVFISNRSLGFIVRLPYAIGSYAILEYE